MFRISTDMIVGTFLSISVLAGFFMQAQTEIMIGLISGLTGYMGKTIHDAATKSETVTEAAISAAIIKALEKQGIGASVGNMIASNAIEAIKKTTSKENRD